MGTVLLALFYLKADSIPRSALPSRSFLESSAPDHLVVHRMRRTSVAQYSYCAPVQFEQAIPKPRINRFPVSFDQSLNEEKLNNAYAILRKYSYPSFKVKVCIFSKSSCVSDGQLSIPSRIVQFRRLCDMKALKIG